MKARLNGYELRMAVEAATHKLCKELNRTPVQIEWTPAIGTAAINASGHIKLANVNDDTVVSKQLFDRYVGFVLHELLHHKYTDFSVRSMVDYVAVLHNAVEDAWIEHTCIDKNLVGNAKGLLSTLVDGMTEEALRDVFDWSDPRQYPYALAVYLRKHATLKVPLANGLEPVFKGAADRLVKARNSADTLQIAEWVFNQLRNLPQKKQQQQQQPQKGSQADEKGSTSPDQASGKGEGAGNKPSASDSVGQATSPTNENGQLRSSAKPVEPQVKSPETDNQSWGASYDKTASLANSHLRSDVRDTYLAMNAVGGRMRYSVKKLFENSGTSEHQRNRRAGSINTKALHTLPMGNDRVFKRRLDVEGIDSAVVIVIDASGSMFPRTSDPEKSAINNALATCAALLETLSAAQVATAVLTFGSTTAVMKNFNTPAKRTIKDLGRVSPAGGTNDYFAVRYAHEMLLGRHEQRKVCFVITDGRGDVVETAKQVKSGTRLGITTIGIGINADIDDIYPNSVRVDDVKSLGKLAFDKVQLAV